MKITTAKCAVCGRDNIPDTELALAGDMSPGKEVKPECRECYLLKNPGRDFVGRWTLRELRDGTVPVLRWWHSDWFQQMKLVEVEDADDTLGTESPWPYSIVFDE